MQHFMLDAMPLIEGYAVLNVYMKEDRMMIENTCEIVAVGKNRQGHVRFWCTKHMAPAYKGAERLDQCAAAHLPLVLERDVLRIAPDDFPGGVAFWGAVPPVYDTTRQFVDFGIHVHACMERGGAKLIDRTYQQVIFDDPQGFQHVINAEAAIYYMTSLVFGKSMKVVCCTRCGASHLDKDWFSVHLHKKHLCAACGRDFFDTEAGIGNPLMSIKEAYGDAEIFRNTIVPERDLTIIQSDYPVGIRLWGSNQAIVWTSEIMEEEGIHVHCYDEDGALVVDDTFRSVCIDGISIDPMLVRMHMAQMALPHLSESLASLSCTTCGHRHTDRGDLAFMPHDHHVCEDCGSTFSAPTRKKLVVSNPLPVILQSLVTFAPRMPQQYTMSLRPEI